MLQMKNEETVSDFFRNLSQVVTQIRNLGEKMEESTMGYYASECYAKKIEEKVHLANTKEKVESTLLMVEIDDFLLQGTQET
ncbi:unnamed protein product [Spirodela intermedia]|uniref:Uncharacterized protein n=1 Tax=Spirodela intermedia TaxID=51605 RepID=A0A7I8K3W3_SPIIN|nr:unnamed protein product [Spirodela intermedia]